MSSPDILSTHTRTPIATDDRSALAALAFTGRIGLSAIFLISGAGKVAAPTATIAFIASAGLPFPRLAYGTSVVVELLGGLALFAGFRVRWVAAALAAFCVATAFSFHAHFADQNQLMHFLKNISMAGGMLQVIALGGGRFSVDAWRRT
jgi:putative oxidoreductase